MFILCFFTQSHLIVPTTPDDWYYISYTRDAIPLFDNHNPTRVFPEIFMPLVSNVSSILLTPLTGDFRISIAYGTAFILALLITIYCANFYLLIRKQYQLERAVSLGITALFLLLHFLIFRTTNLDNPHLFYAFCLTNYNYYTIPILINASLVMFCIRTNYLSKLSTVSYWQRGVFFVLVYVCLLSNLYSNIILAAFLFSYLLHDLYTNNFKLGISIKNNKFVFSMLLFFLGILLLEANGGNAKGLMQNDQSFLVELRKTLGNYHQLVNMINPVFLVVSLIVLLGALVVSLRSQGKKTILGYKFSLFIILNFILLNLFSLLISAKASPHYVAMPDKAFMELFWFVAGVCCSIAYCIHKCPSITSALPILLLLLFCHTNTKTKTFQDVYGYYTMPQIYENMLQAVKEADATDQDSLILYVPKVASSKDNWPFLLYTGKDFSNTFYSYHLTKKRLKIRMEAVPGLTTITSKINESKSDSIPVVSVIE